MEGEIIKRLNKEAETAVEKIKELEKEIENYKTGAESFSFATEALRKIAESEEDLISEISNYLKKLDDLNVTNLAESISDVSKEVNSLKKEVVSLKKEFREGKQKTEKQICGVVKKVDFVFRRKLRKFKG